MTERLVNPYLVGSPLLRREAILSSRIEGTITTPEQLVLLEATGTTTDLSGDTKEVLNYTSAMNLGLNLLEKLPICLRLIRDVHGELLAGVRGEEERPGEFRNTQNYVGRRTETIHSARYVPPPVEEMHLLLNDLEAYLHEDPGDVPCLVRLALIHYQFEAIHPFRDGNGRVGRLLIPLVLCSQGRMPEPLLYLSGFFEQYRDEYVELLLRVSQVGDWIAWIRFFLRAVAQCSEDSASQCDRLLRLRQGYRERFQAARSSALLQKLLDGLFMVPSTTIGQAAKFLKVTHASASSNLRKLEQAGILEELTGRRRGQVFVAREILDLMSDTGADGTIGKSSMEGR
jgi:Fic family protein